MPTTPLPPRLRDLAEAILADGHIDAGDVLRLRRALFADGVADRDEAALLFELDRHGADKAPEWTEFFVEALTDVFVRKQQPPGALSEADGRFLVAHLTHDGKLDSETECRLLLAVLHHGRSVPEAVVALALDAVKQTVLGGGHVRFGPERMRPGVIDEADVELVRKAVFATGGDGGFTVSRREADLLFELHAATRGKKNAQGWNGLFAQAVGHHLMFPGAPPRPVDHAELEARERWLDSRRGPLDFLGEAARAVLDGRLGGTGAPAPSATEDAFARAGVDEAEARWLIGKIPAQGSLDAVERGLLAHLKSVATDLHPSLAPLLARAEA